MRRHILAVAVLLVSADLACAATIKPSSVDQFFITPGQSAVLQWQIESGELPGPVEFALRDYWGKSVESGRARLVGGKTVEVSVRAATGFYEIAFPATRQSFGIVALPGFAGPKDAFFAIDSALSWLVRDDTVREGLVKVLRRSGVVMSRERLGWGQINPAPATWQWEAAQRYETVRQVCARHGVEVLEMFHDSPAWAGRVGKYPQDLVKTSQAWQEIARRWRPTWGALEVWNEPDIFFGGNLPADQYVPLVEATAYAFARGRVDVPLVGGVFAHCNRAYLDNAAANGMLDCVDVVSFHTYGRAMEMAPLVENYRSWLRAHGRETMPLWITECGRPWSRGPDRPPTDQDAASALDVIMKGVEARACGIARYFPFVYPYYEEESNNFGMMDRRGTPLRAMAAYARMVGVLAGKEYLGDLKCDAAVKRARVFGSPQETIAVLYTAQPDAKATLKLGLPVLRSEAVDGRALTVAEGRVAIPDGLTYVWLDRGKLGNRLLTDTPAMRLWKIGRQTNARRAEPSPIIMRFEADPGVLVAKTEGYRVAAKAQSRLPIRLRVFNLAQQPRELTVKLSLPGKATIIEGTDSRPLQLAAGAQADASWVVDLSQPLGATGLATLRFSAEDKSGTRLATRVIDLSGDVSLTHVLHRYPKAARLPIREAPRWTANISGNGRMTMDAANEIDWRLQVKFTAGDRWVYPMFRLPDATDLTRAKGLAIRARCHKPAAVRMFLWEGDSGVGYITPNSIIPADGQWHTAILPFSDFVPSTANALDANGKLDLDQVRRISVGMNSESPENTLDVSDVYVLAGE